MSTPLTAACYCRSTTFTVSHPPSHLTRCTCTFCSKRGVLWAYYPTSSFTLKSNTNNATWKNSIGADHHFCAKCGCGTYSETPEFEKDEENGGFKIVEGKRKISINARLLEDGFDVESGDVNIEVIDGKNLW
ncbi:hypothetical protein HDV00_007950 [Rhizophlyctis rosea]|nr:hypothetical protein HDV00_007950 [Rhizophlyctis rosea]